MVVGQVRDPGEERESLATTRTVPLENIGALVSVRASGAGVNVPSKTTPLVWTARA